MPMSYSPQDWYGPLRVTPDTTSEANGIADFGRSVGGAINKYADRRHEGEMLDKKLSFEQSMQEDQQAFTTGRDDANRQHDLKLFGMEQDAKKADKEREEAERLASFGGVAGALVQQGAINPEQLEWARSLPRKEQAGALESLISFGGFKIKERAKREIDREFDGDPTQVTAKQVPGTKYVIPFAGRTAYGPVPVEGADRDELPSLKGFGQDAAGNPVVGYPYFQAPTGRVGFQRVDVTNGATAPAPGKRIKSSTRNPDGTITRMFDDSTWDVIDPMNSGSNGAAAAPQSEFQKALGR